MGHSRLVSKHQFRGIRDLEPLRKKKKKSCSDFGLWTNSVCALVLPDCPRQWQRNFSEAATSGFLSGHGTKFTLKINHKKTRMDYLIDLILNLTLKCSKDFPFIICSYFFFTNQHSKVW